MSRTERIRQGLAWAEAKGVIRSWFAQSSMPGKRWTLEGLGFSSRTFSTAEVEAFLLGAHEGHIAGLLKLDPGART